MEIVFVKSYEMLNDFMRDFSIRGKIAAIVIGLKGCDVCDELVKTIKLVEVSDLNPDVSVALLRVKDFTALKRLNLNVRFFPTILAFKGGKLRLGWEGFAVLEPNEIQREMVEDVFRQIASLAEEDDQASPSLCDTSPVAAGDEKLPLPSTDSA